MEFSIKLNLTLISDRIKEIIDLLLGFFSTVVLGDHKWNLLYLSYD